MQRMIFICPFLAPLMLAAAMAATGAAEDAAQSNAAGAARTVDFELVSQGMTVGRGSIRYARVLRGGKECLEQRMAIESKVDLLLYKYDLKMEEAWVSDGSGLVAYSLESVEKGLEKKIRGELAGGVFRFDIEEAGKKRTWETPRDSFEISANASPVPAFAEDETRKMIVLDPAACAVSGRTYRGAGREELKVGNEKVMCDTVLIEGPGVRIRRWIASDELGPLVLREDGREKRGSYSRRAVSLRREADGGK